MNCSANDLVNRFAFGAAVLVLSLGALVAQQSDPQKPSMSQATSPDIRVNTEEVNLDMVFHDKKGKTIRDIRPEEIHVFENGVEQHVSTFKYVQGQGEPAEGAAATPSTTLRIDPLRELRFVTLVFENLDLEGKRFFKGALQDILSAAPEQNLYFSVIVIDQKLNMIQQFTNDRDLLMKSVDKSTMWSYPQYLQASAEIKAQLQQTLTQNGTSDPAMAPPVVTTSGSGPSASQVQSQVNYRMAKMQYDMLEQADSAVRESGARASIDALLALVRSESQLPGRKVVVYFNPGLNIPEIAKEQYNFMIGAANRANITFYTVDPKGLVTWSQGGAGRDTLGGAMGESRNLQLNGGRGEVSTSQARGSETAEEGLRSNPLLWLRDLAQQTGGVSIAETNDVKAPLRAVMEDVRSYYEAAYDPHITVFDGKFRTISVKIDRPGIDVHTRSGYYALPQVGGSQQVLAYEVPLLNAIGAATPVGEVPLMAGAERFNERGPKIEYMVTLEAPFKGLTFAPQPDGKNALVDAPILAIVRNSAGEIVEKFSKDFAVQVPQDTVEARKQAASLIQTFRTELSPGTYTLEAAIMDRKGNKIGVTKTPLVVPDPTGKLAISNVVVVRRNDQLKDNQITDPFYYQGGKITPTLNTTLKGGQGNILPFYFAVYPDPAIKDAPKLTMAFYKEGQYLGSAEAPLPPVQKDGRIPYIAALPADKFTPGSYEIKLGVAQGSANAEEKVDFNVN